MTAGLLSAVATEAQSQSCGAGTPEVVTSLSQPLQGTIQPGCNQYFRITNAALPGTKCGSQTPQEQR